MRNPILTKMTLICMKMKLHAELISYERFRTYKLVKQRHKRTRKWPKNQNWKMPGEKLKLNKTGNKEKLISIKQAGEREVYGVQRYIN